jgi:hypothetical protein
MKLAWQMGSPICTAGCIVEHTGHNPRGEYIPKADGQQRPLGVSEMAWSPNGRELFWRSGDKMKVAKIDTETGFTTGKPRLLFSGYVVESAGLSAYDVAPDGQRFLMMKNVEPSSQINVVVNWPEHLSSSSGAGTKR